MLYALYYKLAPCTTMQNERTVVQYTSKLFWLSFFSVFFMYLPLWFFRILFKLSQIHLNPALLEKSATWNPFCPVFRTLGKKGFAKGFLYMFKNLKKVPYITKNDYKQPKTVLKTHLEPFREPLKVPPVGQPKNPFFFFYMRIGFIMMSLGTLSLWRGVGKSHCILRCDPFKCSRNECWLSKSTYTCSGAEIYGWKWGSLAQAHTQYAYIWKYPLPPPPGDGGGGLDIEDAKFNQITWINQILMVCHVFSFVKVGQNRRSQWWWEICVHFRCDHN